MPVRVTQVTEDVWAFTSYDVNGMAFDASTLGRTSTPWFGLPILTQYSSGLYQAQLTIDPTLDIELWTVSYQPGNWPTPGQWVPIRLAEVTATLHMLAVAHCDGWETGNATLDSRIGLNNVTIQRDTGWVEDLFNLFIPGLTASKNATIRNRLMTDLGVGQYTAAPGDGTPCFTLGVMGDGVDGAIIWNSERCPNISCDVGGGGVYAED